MEEGLKQRLVGALVLFLLAIIFLPLILDGRDEENQREVYLAPQEPVIHITHKGSEDVEKRLVVAKEQLTIDRTFTSVPESTELVTEKETPKVEPKQKTVSSAQQSTIEQARELFVKEVGIAKEVAKTPVKAKAAVSEAWTVQIAAFSQLKNAKALQSTLISKSYMAYVESDVSGKKPLYRVFVGPELRRSRAKIIQQALKKEFKLAGMIKTYHP